MFGTPIGPQLAETAVSERLAERQAEQTRQAEQRRREEEARLAEQQRREEEARLAELAKQADQAADRQTVALAVAKLNASASEQDPGKLLKVIEAVHAEAKTTYKRPLTPTTQNRMEVAHRLAEGRTKAAFQRLAADELNPGNLQSKVEELKRIPRPQSRVLATEKDRASARISAQLNLTKAMSEVPATAAWASVGKLISLGNVIKANLSASDKVTAAANELLRARSAAVAEELLRKGEAGEKALREILNAPYTLVSLDVVLSVLPEVLLTRNELEKKGQAVRSALETWMGEKPTVGRITIHQVERQAELQQSNPFLPRSQDLFSAAPGAFTDGNEAASRLVQQRHRVLVLSHGWRSDVQPDPDGKELRAIRSWLKRQDPATLKNCSLFYDWVSVRQREPHTGQMTDQDRAAFDEALNLMGNLFASVHGTSVLRLAPEKMPDAPVELQGIIWLIFEDVDLSTAGLHEVLQMAIAVGRPVKHRYGYKVTLRFKSKEAAADGLARAEQRWPWFKTFPHKEPPGNQTKKEDWPFVHGYGYNEVPYSERKWTIFESGVADATKALLRHERAYVRESNAVPKLVELKFENHSSWPGLGNRADDAERVLDATKQRMEKVLRKSEDSKQLIEQVENLQTAAADALQTAKRRAENDLNIKKMSQMQDADRFNGANQRFFDREHVRV